jgi:hypothetical protein
MPPMDPMAETANRFNELPSETQEFLSQLRPDDLELMKDGLELVRSTRTIGRFARWVVLALLAILMTITALQDNFVKIAAWFSQKG